MKHLVIVILYLSMISCHTKKSISPISGPFEMENLIPWSIVAFDSKERGPHERVNMVKDLGFSQYAFGGRQKHIDTFDEEIEIAKANDVKITAVWLYLNAQKDKPGHLRSQNEKVLEAISKSGIQPQIWVGFNPSYFDDNSDKESFAKGEEMIAYLTSRAEELGCQVGLYNHGGWMGNPDNQLRIIESLQRQNIGIVYNFHHGHKDIDRYKRLFPKLLPHLYCVNLNGMDKKGSKILPIGEGDYEAEMINYLLEIGYGGPWGILGHVKGGDAKVILEKNLLGLKKMSVKEKRRDYKNNKRVFLFAGQSNMEGRADADQLSSQDLTRIQGIQNRVTLYYNRNEPQPLNPVAPKPYIQRKFDLERSFGPELFFGTRLAEAYPDDEFIFIKRSQGGTSLHGCWNPNWSIENAQLMNEEDKPKLFSDFISYTKEVLAHNQKNEYKIEGLLWVQGEADSNKKKSLIPSNMYYQNLKNLIAQTRLELEVPNLPMFIFQVGHGKVVEGMIRLANEDPNVFIITQSKDPNSKQFFEKNPPPIGHYTTKSMKKIGSQFYDLLVESQSQ